MQSLLCSSSATTSKPIFPSFFSFLEGLAQMRKPQSSMTCHGGKIQYPLGPGCRDSLLVKSLSRVGERYSPIYLASIRLIYHERERIYVFNTKQWLHPALVQREIDVVHPFQLQIYNP